MLFNERTTLLQSTHKMNLIGPGKVRFLKDLWTAMRQHGMARCPQFGIDLRKDRVAQLNGFQFQKRVEALFRVVACGLGGDQKLPVRGFQQQQLAANLFYQPRGGFIAAPQLAVGHLLYRQFSRINMLPRPSRIVIQPDAVIALRAPGSFRQGHIGVRRKLVKIVSAGNQLDPRFRLGELQRNVLEPFRAFKPPMPKKFRVKRRGQNRGSSAVVAVTLQRFRGDADKMLCVFARTLQRNRRIIRLLQAKIDFVSCNPPVAIAARPAFFVELQIVRVAGISLVTAPNLRAGAGIAREESNLRIAVWTISIIRAIKVFMRRLFHRLHRPGNAASEELIRSKPRRAVNQVRVNVEELNSMLRQNLLYAVTIKRLGRTRRAIRHNRELPRPCRPIAALRQPYAARLASKKALMRLHAGLYLRTNGRIRSQQREITMRGAAGNDLNSAGIIKMLEAADDVGSELVELPQSLLIKMQPEPRDIHHVRIVLHSEIVSVFVRGFDLPQEIFGEFVFELRMRKLLQQNRREIHVCLQRQALLLQFAKDPQQWKICFSRRFMQPFHPMRPRTVVNHVGQMGMQSKRHISQRFVSGFRSHERIGGPKSEGNQRRPLSYVRCRTMSLKFKFTTSSLSELFCTQMDGAATSVAGLQKQPCLVARTNVKSAVPQSPTDFAIIAQRGKRLEYFTIGWNSLEGLGALTTGIISGSISLVGFGVDSFIEVTSAVALLWRLSVVADEESQEKNERFTLKIVGACFLALSVYVAFVAVSNLLQKHFPAHSVAGILVACAALVAMPLLSRSKKKIGHQLGSGAMVADARQADFCAYLSAILLVGLILNATLGWWWADPVAALVMTPIIAKEGIDALQGKACCEMGCEKPT